MTSTLAATRDAAAITAELWASITGPESFGGTVPVTVGASVPTSGYAVGNGGIFGALTQSDILQFVTENLEWAAETPGAYIGSWINSDTSIVYFDRVIVLHTLDAALALAKENEEIAIWDFANSAEIRVNDDSFTYAAGLVA